MMVITAIEVKVLPDNGKKLRAIANVTLDNLIVIHDIKVVEKEDKLILAMPSKSTKTAGFKDIVHPVNSETRRAFEESIFSIYELAINQKKTIIDVRMKYGEMDNIFSQDFKSYEIRKSSDEYISYSDSTQKYDENVPKQKNETIQRAKTNDFIKWLKL